jgi:hypothetical protein
MELNMALSHEGYGSGSVETHPRAYHNLIKVISRYTIVSSRVNAETWVDPPMEPKEKLLLFARHGIEHPPTKMFEDHLRQVCLQDTPEGADAAELLKKVDAERAKYEEYLVELKRVDESIAQTIREANASCIGGLTLEKDDPAEVMRRWGFMGPLEETPLPLTIDPASATQVDLADLSVRERERQKKKADKRAAKRAANKLQKRLEAEAAGRVDIVGNPADVTVAVVHPLAIALSPQIHPQEQTHVQDQTYVDLDAEDDAGETPQEVRGSSPIIEEAEEEGDLLRHQLRKRRRTEAPGSSTPRPARVLGEDTFDARDTVLDLGVASRMGKYMLLPADMEAFEGRATNDLYSCITAHALAVSSSPVFAVTSSNMFMLDVISDASFFFCLDPCCRYCPSEGCHGC